MRFPTRSFLLIVPVLALLFGGAGCSAEARKQRHLSRAREYYAAGQLDKAELEYINVLESHTMDPDAMAGLGILYFDQGRIGRVYTFLNKARELQPANLEVRTRLANVYLASGKLKEARDEAKFVLDHKPEDSEAPILLAEASAQAADIDETRRSLGALPPKLASTAPVQVALGLLDLRQRHVDQAQAEFERALAADPKSSMAHVGAALVYRAKNDAANAEKYFAQAAQLAPLRSNIQMQYVQFEVQSGKRDVAERRLEELIQKAPDCLPPYLALAGLKADAQKFDESLALVDKVLAREPLQPDAMTLSARLRLAKGEPAKAVEMLERGTKTYPQSPQMFYQLGLAYVAVPDLGKAGVALGEALRLQPDFPLASIVLADVLARQGNTNAAIETLKPIVQRHPEIGDAQLALARAYSRQGNLDEALTIYRRLEKALPNNPQLALYVGRVLIQQKKPVEARQVFERALQASPDFLPILEQLVDLDMEEKQFAAAQTRVTRQIAKDPKAAAPQLLLAKIYIGEGDAKNAESTLQKVIALQPDLALPYVMLARLYITTGQQDKAIANLQQASKNDAKNAEPVMMLAVLYDQQKNYPAARDSYEKLLQLNPRFSPGLNNLAYLYSEQFNELDKAFALAQRAREMLPNEPHAADTLGWILFKRKQYSWALSLLTESAEKLPTEADVVYHLGMTYYMLGQEKSARAALQQALKVNDTFPGADEARRALAMLDLNPATADAGTLATLEKRVAEAPDPVALARLGALYEQKKDAARAATAYENALKISPSDTTAALGLIRVLRSRHESAKAIELAKDLRKTAPADPDVARALGELAFETGDYNWAFSLLQEVTHGEATDPATGFAYAQAAYYSGRVDTATSTLEELVKQEGNPTIIAQARQMLELITLSQDDSRALAAADKIQTSASSDANSLPAQMALGKLKAAQKDFAAAAQVYKQVLERAPMFTPARRELTLVLAATPAKDPQAVEIATKARDAFPNDPLVAKAAGIIYFRDGSFQRAGSLLEQAARTLNSDAELAYYLGMAQSQLKNRTASTASLKRALELGLPPELATKAREIVSAGPR